MKCSRCNKQVTASPVICSDCSTPSIENVIGAVEFIYSRNKYFKNIIDDAVMALRVINVQASDCSSHKCQDCYFKNTGDNECEFANEVNKLLARDEFKERLRDLVNSL